MSVRTWLNERFEAWGQNVAWTSRGIQVLNSATKDPFPRVWLQGGVSGGGWPLIDPRTGKIVEEIAAQIARWNFWCVQPSYFWTAHRFALEDLRRRNPKLKIFAQFILHSVWGTPGVDGGYQDRFAGICQGRTYPRMDGRPSDWPMLIDPEVAGPLGDLFAEVMRSGAFDGCMLDPVSPASGWLFGVKEVSPPATPELLEEWNNRMRAVHGTLIARLRAEFPSAIILGNGGPFGDYAGAGLANGWVRENFPLQNLWPGLTGLQSNLEAPRGLMGDPARYSDPPYSLLCLKQDTRDVGFTERVKFALACSCLGEAILTVGPSNFPPASDYRDWWSLYYGMHRTTGAAVGYANGYLGRPLGPAYRLPVDAWHPESWRRDFVFGFVEVDLGNGTATIQGDA